MPDPQHIGRRVVPIVVDLQRDAVFEATLYNRAGEWEEAPRFVFIQLDDTTEVWQSVLQIGNNAMAIVQKTSTEVNARFPGEEVQMWVGDKLVAEGQVSFSG